MYHATILLLDKTLFEGQVRSLTLPGTLGYMEILTNHAPIISSLKPGLITVIDEEGQKLEFQIKDGVLKVLKNQATVLAVA